MNTKYLGLLIAYSLSTVALARPYMLKNNSKTNIKYVQCTAAEAKNAKTDNENTFLTLSSGIKAMLTSLPAGQSVTLESDNPYCFRAAGTGSSWVSYYYDIPINNELDKANTGWENPLAFKMNETPVLLINPTSTAWSFELQWQEQPKEKSTPSKVTPPAVQPKKTEEKPASPKSTESTEINDILAGSLGAEYAQKAKEIIEYDYTATEKRGLINLKKALLKDINDVYTKYHSRPANKMFIQPAQATAEEIKKSIDMYHRSLQRFRAMK